jgi:hypothetical protein
VLLIALFSLLGIALISYAFVKSPNSGAALLLVLFTVGILWVDYPPLPFGLNVFPPDIVFSLLFSAGILRYLLGKTRLTRQRALVLAMTLLFLLALARGILTFGIKQAGVPSRSLFYVYAGAIYFSSFNFRRWQQRKIIQYWLNAAWAVAIIVILRWIATGMGMEIVESWKEAEASSMRVINAGQTMFLCVALFFALILVSRQRATSGQHALVYVLLPMVILLQHRTVWVVFLFGMMWLFSKQTQALRKVLIAVLGVLLIAIPLILTFFDTAYVTEALLRSATDPTTLIWRVAGWRQLIVDRKASPIDYIIGQPAGADESRVINNSRVEANPHDFYVQTFLSEGTLGLGLLLWLYISQIRLFRKGRRSVAPRREYMPYRMWGLFLIAHMLYFITYSQNYDQSLILGMAVGISSSTLAVRSRSRVSAKVARHSTSEGFA